MTVQSDKSRPWYKEPYVWLVIFFPMLAVVAGIYTIRLAVMSDDGLVADDYYKQGLEINLTLARDKQALARQMRADMDFQHDEKKLFVTLQSTDSPDTLPDKIDLHLQYSTRAGLDQHLQLQRIGNNDYFANLPSFTNGNWIVELAGDDWRLVKTVRLPQTKKTTLLPLTHIQQ